VLNDRVFGDLLRELRCAAGLSQEALAELARLSPGAISSLERSARRGPQQATLSLLSDALKLDPAQRAQLEQAAAAGRRRGVRTSTLPAASAAPPRHNLRHSPTSFHGHETDLAQLEGLIAVRRSITLLGSGGVGKTRLALELARGLVEKNVFPDGVWLVELAPLASPDLVASAISRALSVRERANEALTLTVAGAIGSKRLALVLDNCEHVLDESARIAEALLSSCPGIVLIATTREALRIDGECIFRVAPLPTEGSDATGTALDLLLDRLIDADFTRFSQISPDDRALATTICQRLDGVPLALELAAGRARDLSLRTIVTGLDERFSLLAGGRRSAEPRQQTLRGTIDWSYELLTVDERESFARLGLFAAAFTLDAAADICASDAAAFRETLAALVAKSLVTIVEEDDGRLRYRLLETMRAFALDRLRASGRYDTYARRFAAYFCARAKAADVKYRRVSDGEFFDLVGADIDNFRAALEWSLGQRNDTQLGAELAGALGWAYRQTALSREGARWAERALAQTTTVEPAVIGRLVMALCHFSFQFGQLKDSYDAAVRAAALYEDADRPSDVCWALTQQVYCLYLLGRPDDARAVGERAIAVARAQRDAFRLGGALSAYALTIPIERATERFATLEEAIAAYREAGAADAIVPTASLAETHYATGNYAAALDCGLQVVAMTRENRDHANLASALANVAAYALTVEDVVQADRAAREALELLARVGETRVATTCCLQHLGSVAAQRGFYVRAARLVGASNSVYRAFGLEREFTEQSLYDRTLAQINAGIGKTAAQQHLDAGAALPIEAAIAEALEPTELHVSM
jgi:predicted ATPase/transcriptional regulator with XRE-family HTH domain